MTPGETDTPGTTAGKAEWRQWVRRVRGDIDWPSVSEAVVAALHEWIPPDSRVLLYDPLPDEVDLLPLVASFATFVTRTPDDGGLTVHPYDSVREVHRLGFSQPIDGSPEIDPADIDVVLLPGLAFDRAGVRLGRGGGHYDRLLPRLPPDCALVGVASDAVVVDRLPREEHDVLVTHLATESGVGMVRR
ncbi:MAG: 5-formyltetrahydrofolate cyclo-ligase [Acidimicrobiia bacterium]